MNWKSDFPFRLFPILFLLSSSCCLSPFGSHVFLYRDAIIDKASCTIWAIGEHCNIYVLLALVPPPIMITHQSVRQTDQTNANEIVLTIIRVAWYLMHHGRRKSKNSKKRGMKRITNQAKLRIIFVVAFICKYAYIHRAHFLYSIHSTWQPENLPIFLLGFR